MSTADVVGELERARGLLVTGGHALVLCRTGSTIVGESRGLADLVRALESDTDLAGWVAADRVVGRAAALLYAAAGVVEVYAPVMSGPALATLRAFAIGAYADREVPALLDRSGSGPCPMERLVSGTDDPRTAFHLIQQAVHARATAGHTPRGGDA